MILVIDCPRCDKKTSVTIQDEKVIYPTYCAIVDKKYTKRQQVKMRKMINEAMQLELLPTNKED